MCAGLRELLLGFLLLLLLLPLSGADEEYGVMYQQPEICAVENSSVFIPCSFFYPSALKVVRVMWGHERNDIYLGPFLFDSNDTLPNSRFQYRGDKKDNCSLTIHPVGHNDSGKYAFRFVTDDPVGKYTGVDGSTLRVVGLSILPLSLGETKEGDSVRLTCQSDCEGAEDPFVWFKDGALVRAGAVLDLSDLSESTSGDYACSLSAHPETTSGVKRVDVEYGPKGTSAGPPVEVDGGQSVSLVCSSRANPPVGSYVWFRIQDGVRVVGNRSVLVTGEDGEYFCGAMNKHGSQNSSVVAVTIKGNRPLTAYVSVTVVVILIVIAVVVAVRIKKNTKGAPKTEYRQDVQDLTRCDASQTVKTSQAVRTEESTDVVYTSVHFTASRRQQKRLSSDEVIYSTVRI